jgi:hypothetical protein
MATLGPRLDPDLAAALALLQRVFGADPEPLRVVAVHANQPRRHLPEWPWSALAGEQTCLPGFDAEGRGE